jgi:hypothetical protein
MNALETVNRCSANSDNTMREGGTRGFDRFVLGTMATNTLYDCANNMSPTLFDQFKPCNLPWDRNMMSYQIYERNGEIKRAIPLQERPPLGFCDVKPRRNFSLYN